MNVDAAAVTPGVPSDARTSGRWRPGWPANLERDLKRVLRFHALAALGMAALLTFSLVSRSEHAGNHPPGWGEMFWSLRVAAMCVVGQVLMHRWRRIGYVYAAAIAIPVLSLTVVFTLLFAIYVIVTVGMLPAMLGVR